jgi:hypothetical protein
MIFISAVGATASGQSVGDYRSVATGNWNSTSTWGTFDGSSWVAAVATPTSSDGVITIRNGHTVTVTASVTVDQVTVDAGGQVTINNGFGWTIANGTGNDLIINGTVLNSGLTLFSSAGPTWLVNAGGTYIHNTASGIATPLSGAVLDRASNFIYRGSSTLTPAVSFVPVPKRYGNLTFESTSGSWTASVSGSGLYIIDGDFTIGSGVTFLNALTLIVQFGGNFTNNGTLTNSTGDQFYGFVGNGKSIGGSSSVEFETWSLTGSASITLSRDVSIASGFTGSVSGTLICGSNKVVGAGNFSLSSGATLIIGSPDGITSSGATGNIQVAGTRTFDAGANYTYNGSVPQHTGNGLPATVNNLTIANSSGVTLDGNTTVAGTLTITNGSLSTGSNLITIGFPDGVLSESAGKKVNGNVQATRTLSQGVNEPFGQIGVEINAVGVAPGSTSVLRVTGTAQSGGGNSSIMRYYDVTPTTNTGLNATMVFHYDDSELNNNAEGDLVLFRSTDGGTTWANMLFTGRDATANTITLTGINAMSRWTAAAESSPLPIQLASFTGSVVNGTTILLRWVTLSEINNYGFFVQRHRSEEPTFIELPNSFVPGHGTTIVPQYYSFTDSSAVPGALYYRLKQVDLDGTVHYTDAIRVEIVTGVAEHAAEAFALVQNYPNPFNPSTTIEFEVPSLEFVGLKVYDVLGREVATLVNEKKAAGTYEVTFDASHLPSGVYFYRLEAGSFVQTRKMLLVR